MFLTGSEAAPKPSIISSGEGSEMACCSINVTEVYAGLRPGEETKTEALLAGLEPYELSGLDARFAGKLKSSWARRGRTLTLEDTIVAAIAIERGCARVTDNCKDFPMPEVQLYPLP